MHIPLKKLRLGLEKVNEIGFLAVPKQGIPLVGTEKRPRTTFVNGWYVYNKLGAERMSKILRNLSNLLGCSLDVTIIEPDAGRAKSVARRVFLESEGKLVEVEGKSYADTFRKTIEMIGVERVRELNIIRSGRNIVYELEAGNTPGEGQLDLGNGLYLDTHQSSIDKDALLRRISEALHITIQVVRESN